MQENHKKIFIGVLLLVVALFVANYFFGLGATTGSPGFAKHAMVAEYDYADDGAMAMGKVAAFEAEEMAGLVDTVSRNSIVLPPSPEPPGFETGGGDEFIPDEPLIIRTANLSVVVDDVAVAAGNIASYAVEKGGFEVNRNIYKQGNGWAGSVTIKIPSRSFDEGIDMIRGEGEIKSQQTSGRDVTEEFVDVSAQLANLKATEEQFLEIMKKAFKIEDVLNVQRELSNVRSQIERMEGRKRYLETSASLSTITVHLSTDPEELPVIDEDDKWKPLAVVKDSARNLIGVFQSLANFVIWFVVYIPLWALLVLLVWLGKKVWFRYRG